MSSATIDENPNTSNGVSKEAGSPQNEDLEQSDSSVEETEDESEVKMPVKEFSWSSNEGKPGENTEYAKSSVQTALIPPLDEKKAELLKEEDALLKFLINIRNGLMPEIEKLSLEEESKTEVSKQPQSANLAVETTKKDLPEEGTLPTVENIKLEVSRETEKESVELEVSQETEKESVKLEVSGATEDGKVKVEVSTAQSERPIIRKNMFEAIGTPAVAKPGKDPLFFP